jgi:malonyl-CoA decarboxylase
MQPGLKGVELGGLLIKRVVDQLRWEFPHLDKFSTLSPIPNFRSWLVVRLHEAARGTEENLLTHDEVEAWKTLLVGDEGDFWNAAIEMVQKNSWARTERGVAVMEQSLTRLCARYLYLEKHRGNALDPVGENHADIEHVSVGQTLRDKD